MNLFSGTALNFFVKEAVLSLAVVVEKPLQVDLATKNQTRPSCARVKVEVDLLRDFPHKITVGVRKRTGKVVEKNIWIKYDYLPKYFKSCKIQGHDEEHCFVLHPELYRKNEKEEDKVGDERQQKRKSSSCLSKIIKDNGKDKNINKER